MATLAQIIQKVRRLLGDPGGASPLYEDELLTNGVLESLTAILPWASKESSATLTGDGTTSEFALPVDCARVEAVWSQKSEQILPSAGLFPLSPWGGGEGSALEHNAWLDYPHGKVSFSTAPASGEILKIYYSAYWSEPAGPDEELATPGYTLPGIAYYTAAYALSPKATGAANVRQYNTKVDSGIPIHNPMVDMAKYFLARFESEMSRAPVQTRGQRSR